MAAAAGLNRRHIFGEMTMYDRTKFEPASHGAGKRHWGAARLGGLEWARDKRGRVIWVASHEAAVRLAERANKNLAGA